MTPGILAHLAEWWASRLTDRAERLLARARRLTAWAANRHGQRILDALRRR